MSIYEKAMKMELEGKEMYEEMLSKTTDAGLKGVFAQLAQFEDNHYQVFKSLADKSAKVEVEELALPSLKEIVFNLKKDAEQEDLDAVVEQYKQALALEEENEQIYLEFADNASSDEEKVQFLAVAAEEKKHKAVIQSIIECIEGPVLGIESAEF